MTDQANEQSVMDRLTSKMSNLTGITNDQPSEESLDTPDEPQSDIEEIEWEGAKYQVPSRIKEALMKNADYSQKTQALAEQRKVLDHAQELAKQAQMERAFNDSVAGEHRELAVVEAYLEQMGKMNWGNMKTEDVLRAKIEIDSIKERRDTIKQSIASKRGKFDEDMKAALAQHRSKAREMASKAITGFSEDTEKSVRSYAASKGLSDAEIDNVLLDPRSFGIIWEASQYAKIAAGVKPAQAAAERALKPSGTSEKMPAEVRAKLDYRKAIKSAKTSGQKAELIEGRIAGMFGGRR